MERGKGMREKRRESREAGRCVEREEDSIANGNQCIYLLRKKTKDCDY